MIRLGRYALARDGWRLGFARRIQGGMDTPTHNQLQFQWALDDGNEAASTLLLSPGSDVILDLSGGDGALQLRFVVEEDAGFASNNYTDQYESDLNASGTWESVTTTENGDGVNVDTTNLTNLAPSTQRVGVGTFITTNDGQTTDGSPGGPAHDYAGNDEAEMVCAFNFFTASLSDGDTIDFRMRDVDTRTAGSNARVTISKAAPFVAELTAASFGMTGQALIVLAEFDAQLTAASFAMVAQAIDVVVVFTAELTAAAFPTTAQDLEVLAAFDAQLTAASFAMSAQDIDINAAFERELTTAAFAMTAQDIQVTVSFTAELTAASFAMSPQDIQVNENTVIELTAASFGLNAEDIDVSVILSQVTLSRVMTRSMVRPMTRLMCRS